MARLAFSTNCGEVLIIGAYYQYSRAAPNAPFPAARSTEPELSVVLSGRVGRGLGPRNMADRLHTSSYVYQ